jgi:hypothetical protein
MNNKIVILIITFIVFTYITSIVHSQYIDQVSNYFSTNRPPKYSYENFIKTSYTSLPLLPINILIDILLMSLISAVIYIMFVSLFTKQNITKPITESPSPNIKSPNIKNIETNVSTPITESQSDNTNLLLPKTHNKSFLNSIKSATTSPKLKSFKNMFKGGAEPNIKTTDIPITTANNIILTDKITPVTTNNITSNDSKPNIFKDYLKSLSNFNISFNIFKWFIYILIFNMLYFIVFLLFIKINIIDKKKLSDELYVKSIVHYYITGFYISSAIIYLIVVSNM